MTEKKSEAELDIYENKFNDLLAYFSSLVFERKCGQIPDSLADLSEVHKLSSAINEIRNVLFMAKNGDFSYSIESKGFMAGTLKALQSNLKSIAYIAQQVERGDFSQKLDDYMGEFSISINSMIVQLANFYKNLNEEKNRYSYRAFHDPLTGLKNRAFFDEQFINEIARAKRNNSLLAVVVVDMDEFKKVNDTMGHQSGDVLLIEVANRLLKGTREIDTVARIGGDEFGMLWPSYPSLKQHFVKIKNRVLSHINAYFELGGSEYQISISMGISVYPYDGDNPQTLFRIADNAMYEAKKTAYTSCVFASLDKFDQ